MEKLNDANAWGLIFWGEWAELPVDLESHAWSQMKSQLYIEWIEQPAILNSSVNWLILWGLFFLCCVLLCLAEDFYIVCAFKTSQIR